MINVYFTVSVFLSQNRNINQTFILARFNKNELITKESVARILGLFCSRPSTLVLPSNPQDSSADTLIRLTCLNPFPIDHLRSGCDEAGGFTTKAEVNIPDRSLKSSRMKYSLQNTIEHVRT